MSEPGTDPAGDPTADPTRVDVPAEPRPFRYDGEVQPGEKRHLRYEIGETYLGNPVEIPVTIIDGDEPTSLPGVGVE